LFLFHFNFSERKRRPHRSRSASGFRDFDAFPQQPRVFDRIGRGRCLILREQAMERLTQ
jgi:hypothetical protein